VFSERDLKFKFDICYRLSVRRLSGRQRSSEPPKNVTDLTLILKYKVMQVGRPVEREAYVMQDINGISYPLQAVELYREGSRYVDG